MSATTLALIILAAILIQLAVIILLGFFRRRLENRNLAGSMNETVSLSKVNTPIRQYANTPIRTSAELVIPESGWDGFKEFMVQRRELEDKNNVVCSFYLAPVDGKPLTTFKPGQFLTFKLQIKDPDNQQLKSVVRCYSLSDAAHPDYYRVSIKRIPAPHNSAGIPPGLSSCFFHDQVQEGSRLLIKAPSGHFHLMEDEPLPVVLIGGGIGITPMLSILNTLLETGINREIWLYYGICNGNEHIMKTHLQTLADKHPDFHLTVCYSAPNENDSLGVDYQHRGWVDMPLLRATLKLMRYQFYVCGPRPMMESLVPGLQDWGVDSHDIYYESFGPASLKQPEKKAVATNSQPITVTFSRSGKSILWNPAMDSLLDFAEDNDIDVESGCRAGSCGSCQTTLKVGEVTYNQQPDADITPGHCLLCISTPKNNLTLEA